MPRISPTARPLWIRIRPRLTLPAILCIGLAAGCSQTSEIPVQELVREGNLLLDPETRQPYSGLAFATYEGRAGVVAQKMGVGADGYDGPFEGPLADRHVSSREAYTDGVKHGPYQWYFESGQLFEEGTYLEGRLDGPYRAYWENGDLYEEGTYRNGQYEGSRRWYLNNRLVELVTYRAGVMNGLYERYDEDGDLDLKGMLAGGTPCGKWIEGDQTVTYPICVERVTD